MQFVVYIYLDVKFVKTQHNVKFSLGRTPGTQHSPLPLSVLVPAALDNISKYTYDYE